jgi:hypothetical protein
MQTIMQRTVAEMLDFPSKKPDAMNSFPSSANLIREMIEADRSQYGLSRAIERVARACDLTFRRVRAIWNAEVKRLWAEEETQIRRAYAAWADAETSRLEARHATLVAFRDALRRDHEEIAGNVRNVASPSMGRRWNDVPQQNAGRAG